MPVNNQQHKTQRKGKGSKKKVYGPSKSQLKKLDLDQEIAEIDEKILTLTSDAIGQDFDGLPLSQATALGLKDGNFVTMTSIQRAALPHALSGRDVLGAAKTGSGKTLSFLIPALERLYRSKWTSLDGLGVLILSPTRELALQIFEVLRKIGKHHSFSAGLLIGGKDLRQEQDRVGRMNILVCTPGRLLQHMDQTPDFFCDNLQMLVLDEADRCLDIGFEKALNAIIEHLPQERQTLLFSATQTKSVKDLARLSLKDPEYVAVHEASESATPTNLTQKYAVIDLPQKLDVLFSFLKSHVKSKILVFVSSCKQVRFIHESFCKMQPGIPLLCLFGKQKQPKRMAIFEQFCRKQSACLIATDIAARGLDFPAVDWVIQVDCPENAETYIHRVGRTARYEALGNGFLFLTPSEEAGMVKEFEKKKIPVQKIKVNPSRTTSVKGALQAYCSQYPEMKYLGQKCFISYMRSVYLQANKDIFDVHALPAEEFAESLGLPGAPKISFVKKSQKKNEPRAQPVDVDESDREGSDASSEEQIKPQSRTTKVDKMFNKKNLTILSDHYAKLKHDDEEDNENASDDDLLTIKRADHDVDDLPELKAPAQPLSHRQVLKSKTKELKERGLGKKFSFDEDGNPLLKYRMESLDQFAKERPLDTRLEEYVSKQTSTMKEADALDKKVQKERVRERKLEKKRKERAARQEASGAAAGVSLGPPVEDDDFNMSGEHYNSDAGSAASFNPEHSGKRTYSSDDASESAYDAPASKKVRLDDLDKKRLEDMARALLNQS